MSLITDFDENIPSDENDAEAVKQFYAWLGSNSTRIYLALHASQKLIDACYKSDTNPESGIGWAIHELEETLK